MSAVHSFDSGPILRYLALDTDYKPSPDDSPIEFLKRHMSHLPPHLLVLFNAHPETTPRARASVPAIRNRRCAYAATDPKPLDPDVLSRVDPGVWDLVNSERSQALTIRRPTEEDEAEEDERGWASSEFQDGSKLHVGKIGELLAELEGERRRERERAVRRQVLVARAREEETLEEEEESSDEEESVPGGVERLRPDPAEEDIRRTIRERFLSGLLTNVDYDIVDWDEKWDPDDREDEERWFDDEEES
ncbi:hypothetical protein RSOLAG1IB_05739 [Rhizoctonia solani AG-1 IB]|uniref:Uncharacterized protein n=2 Tax=Rhizoctonia solani TaxID=456999 RepID=M5C3R4_THACB|nr:unnamed protein product [Rhizoctonia solani]CCO33665.1 hypothetical protein BN14_07750 [Rhizoctonia solani AG-1 IB]CEL52535.1 hypothetical protein RSOLAG1IB_05739 [Rhizoctonia solani AG-1 IB]